MYYLYARLNERSVCKKKQKCTKKNDLVHEKYLPLSKKKFCVTQWMWFYEGDTVLGSGQTCTLLKTKQMYTNIYDDIIQLSVQ